MFTFEVVIKILIVEFIFFTEIICSLINRTKTDLTRIFIYVNMIQVTILRCLRRRCEGNRYNNLNAFTCKICKVNYCQLSMNFISN